MGSLTKAQSLLDGRWEDFEEVGVQAQDRVAVSHWLDATVENVNPVTNNFIPVLLVQIKQY